MIGTISALLFFVERALAAIPDPAAVPGLTAGGTTESFKSIIIRIIEKILDYVLLVAMIYVIVAGIRLIISGGEEGEKDKAKKTIIYVIIGIIIVLLARVIVIFVNKFVG